MFTEYVELCFFEFFNSQVRTGFALPSPRTMADAPTLGTTAVMTIRELKAICIRHGIDTSAALERADLVALAQPFLAAPVTNTGAAPSTSRPAPDPSSAAAPAPSSAAAPAPSSAAASALSPEPAAPSLHVRKAYRDVDGAFDGDTDDSDEEHAADGGFRPSKRPRPGSSPPSRHDGSRVWLLPRAGPTVTVVATADLHR